MMFSINKLNDKGSLVRHGHWTWWLDKKMEKKIGCEWYWFHNSWSIGLDIGAHDHAFCFNVCIGLLCLYLNFDWFKLANWLSQKTKRPEDKYGNGRQISIRIFDWAIWFDLWADPMAWNKTDPRWWQFNFRPADFFLGRAVYSKKDLDMDRVEVCMPEAVYPCTVVIFESTWKRPRWFARKMVRAEITPLTPIPFPGKGENSWDCGEDATHSLTCPVDTPFKAAMALTESVLRSRWLHGGKMWRPTAKAVK